jgi:hypothetical protein
MEDLRLSRRFVANVDPVRSEVLALVAVKISSCLLTLQGLS